MTTNNTPDSDEPVAAATTGTSAPEDPKTLFDGLMGRWEQFLKVTGENKGGFWSIVSFIGAIIATNLHQPIWTIFEKVLATALEILRGGLTFAGVKKGKGGTYLKKKLRRGRRWMLIILGLGVGVPVIFLPLGVMATAWFGLVAAIITPAVWALVGIPLSWVVDGIPNLFRRKGPQAPLPTTLAQARELKVMKAAMREVPNSMGGKIRVWAVRVGQVCMLLGLLQPLMWLLTHVIQGIIPFFTGSPLDTDFPLFMIRTLAFLAVVFLVWCVPLKNVRRGGLIYATTIYVLVLISPIMFFFRGSIVRASAISPLWGDVSGDQQYTHDDLMVLSNATPDTVKFDSAGVEYMTIRYYGLPHSDGYYGDVNGDGRYDRLDTRYFSDFLSGGSNRPVEPEVKWSSLTPCPVIQRYVDLFRDGRIDWRDSVLAVVNINGDDTVDARDLAEFSVYYQYIDPDDPSVGRVWTLPDTYGDPARPAGDWDYNLTTELQDSVLLDRYVYHGGRLPARQSNPDVMAATEPEPDWKDKPAIEGPTEHVWGQRSTPYHPDVNRRLRDIKRLDEVVTSAEPTPHVNIYAPQTIETYIAGSNERGIDLGLVPGDAKIVIEGWGSISNCGAGPIQGPVGNLFHVAGGGLVGDLMVPTMNHGELFVQVSAEPSLVGDRRPPEVHRLRWTRLNGIWRAEFEPGRDAPVDITLRLRDSNFHDNGGGYNLRVFWGV